MNSPLTRLESLDGGEIRAEKTKTGWHYGTASGLRAVVKGFRDGIICRVGPCEDREVVQLGCGAIRSRLCNALYSPSCDSAMFFEADELRLEPIVVRERLRGFSVSAQGPLTITILRDLMRVYRGLKWFKPLDCRRFPRAHAGWCSWYYYYLRINEREVVKNADRLAENLKKFGCEWVQMDDGWQGRGDGFGTNRDWFVICEKDFPKGDEMVC